jgi:hypothetical protein
VFSKVTAVAPKIKDKQSQQTKSRLSRQLAIRDAQIGAQSQSDFDSTRVATPRALCCLEKKRGLNSTTCLSIQYIISNSQISINLLPYSLSLRVIFIKHKQHCNELLFLLLFLATWCSSIFNETFVWFQRRCLVSSLEGERRITL